MTTKYKKGSKLSKVLCLMPSLLLSATFVSAEEASTCNNHHAQALITIAKDSIEHLHETGDIPLGKAARKATPHIKGLGENGDERRKTLRSTGCAGPLKDQLDIFIKVVMDIIGPQLSHDSATQGRVQAAKTAAEKSIEGSE